MMKNKILLILTCGLFLPFIGISQERYEKPDYFEVYFSGGGVSYFVPQFGMNEAKQLIPNSTLLKSDLSRFFGYNTGRIYYGGGYNSMLQSSMSGSNFNAQIGLYQFGKNKNRKNNPQLRFGVSYASIGSSGSSWYYSTSTPMDTFTSSSGQQIFTDSIYSESIGLFYSGNQLNFNADMLIHTNPDRRFSIFIGLGIQAGLTFNNRTELNYTAFSSDNRGYQSSWGNYNGMAEVANNKSGWIIGAYIPAGINLRLGKTTPVLNQTSLFWELRPGITALAIPELQTYLSGNVQVSAGLRVRL